MSLSFCTCIQTPWSPGWHRQPQLVRTLLVLPCSTPWFYAVWVVEVTCSFILTVFCLILFTLDCIYACIPSSHWSLELFMNRSKCYLSQSSAIDSFSPSAKRVSVYYLAAHYDMKLDFSCSGSVRSDGWLVSTYLSLLSFTAPPQEL